MNLVRSTLSRPVTFTMLFVASLILGAISLSRLRLAFLPTLDFPMIWIQLPYRGADPEEIERQILEPVEGGLATLSGIKKITSRAREAEGIVGLHFDFGQSLDLMKVMVREKMERIRDDLPEDFEDYFLFSFNTEDIPMMVGRVSARGEKLSDRYEWFEQHLKAPLERIDGVGRVQLFGLVPPEVMIYVRAGALRQYAVDMGALIRRLTSGGVDRPIGSILEGPDKINLRSLSRFTSIDEIKAFPVPDRPGLTLGDIAEIGVGFPRNSEPRRLNGGPALGFAVTKTSGANTVEVSRRVREALDVRRSSRGFETLDLHLFHDEAENILKSLDGLLESGFYGGLIATVILLAFLGSLTDTIIVILCIPLCMLLATSGLYLMGKTLNLMTLMGMVLAVGMLVDNSIVVLENINRLRQEGRDASPALHGATQVALAISSSTLTTVIIFLPVIYGRPTQLTIWLRDVALTISMTLIASLLISLTLVPLLASRVHGSRRVSKPRQPILNWFRRRYTWALKQTMRHPAVFFLILLLTLGSAALPVKMKWMNTEPDDQTIHDVIRVSCEFLDGASLDEVEFIVGRVEASLLPLRQDLGVRDMFSRMSAGRAIFELFLKDPDKSTSEFSKLKERVRKSLPDLAGIRFRLGGEGDPGSQEEEVDTVNLTLFGDSADRLDAWGTRVLQIMQQIKGVRHAFRGAVVPSRDVVLGPDQSPLGISAQRLTQTLQFTLRGSRVAPVRLGDRELQAWVLLHPDDREGMSDLDSLVVANQSQGLVPLGSVSRRSYQESLGEIRRESKQRIYPITLELTSEHPQNMHEIVKDVLGTLSWPAGMSWSFGQRFSDEEADNTQMIQSSFLAIFLVFLVMASLFEALAGPFLILFTIPFALVGVVWYVTIFQIPMGVMTSIGAFLLLGIVVNNGIILVDTINRNRREGQSIERAILTAGRDRFRPIWMTALTTIFGMLPMALGRAAVGKGLYSPLAHAIIGGLSFCTVWTLLAIPYLYWMFDTFTRAAILAWRILILSEPFDVISRK